MMGNCSTVLEEITSFCPIRKIFFILFNTRFWLFDSNSLCSFFSISKWDDDSTRLLFFEYEFSFVIFGVVDKIFGFKFILSIRSLEIDLSLSSTKKNWQETFLDTKTFGTQSYLHRNSPFLEMVSFSINSQNERLQNVTKSESKKIRMKLFREVWNFFTLQIRPHN